MAKLNSKKKGIRFENQIRKTVNSGATWFSPGDLSDDKYIIEAKYTDKKGFRIPLSMIEKIWIQALDMGKEPLLSVGIKRNENEVFVLDCQIRLQRK